MNNLYHVAINSTQQKVYELERATGGEIVLIRGKGAGMMEHLKPQTFDFIYSALADGTPANFHPGVALAVADEIGTVNQEHGFWWVWLKNGVWHLEPPAGQLQREAAA